ncbi:LysR substrate-binding domain-containing protein [Burkholderia guangdongensis]|uniref:LysR substrate-binding domain-containing protein n=1 Tax=Burkholderia guangdongensis TaxID=1792500 RepID=UPI0015C97918|nr:LysR substrate-binding domain-containing protein [Burkholderia guangdongensis]
MHLPSITALRALDAIARHGSASRAAAELCLTRSAISHQINTLEETLGFAVLERAGRGIVLTYRGARYIHDARRALGILEEAAHRSAGGEVAGRLRVSCAPGFAVYWLSHHVGAFHRAYPHVELSITSPRTADEVGPRDADLFIAYGNGDWPDFAIEPITSLSYFPVCSPTLVNARGRPLTLDDLADVLLLHMGGHTDWVQWLATAGAHHVDGRRGIVFSEAPFAQQAAISGQGIAIGDTLVSGDALARGLLILPFDVTMDSPRGYYLVATPERAQRAEVRAFSDWLLEEHRVSARAWRTPPRQT